MDLQKDEEEERNDLLAQSEGMLADVKLNKKIDDDMSVDSGMQSPKKAEAKNGTSPRYSSRVGTCNPTVATYFRAVG